VWNKGATGVLEQTKDVEIQLPFPINGFDFDNGSEWLNWTLIRYLRAGPRTGFRVFESTNSAAHVATMMQRVRSLPGTWQPADQIRVRSKTIKPLSEGQIYDVLNMSLVVPWRRV
jgi:hypothetical protein